METKDEKPDIVRICPCLIIHYCFSLHILLPFQSIIFPVYNGSCFLDDCLRSITKQIKNTLNVELSVFNDGSTDDSLDIILKWKTVLEDEGFKVLIGGHEGPPKGGILDFLQNLITCYFIYYTVLFSYAYSIVGYAKNQSIQQSSGEYLCFQDSVMYI